MKKHLFIILLTTIARGAFGQTIINPSFEDGTNGWTVSHMQLQSNNELSSYKDGSTYLERWIKAPGLLGSASVRQTVTGLANGIYRLTASAMNTSQSNQNDSQIGAWIVANGLRTVVTKLGTYTLDFFVTDGTADIGFVADGATGNWVACDKFSLTYQGNTTALIQSTGNTVKTYATNLMNSVGGDKTAYNSLVNSLSNAINNGNLNTVANAAKAVVAGERPYRLLNPSGSGPTVTTNHRHARGSIWIFGRMTCSGSNIAEEGFCWSTSPNPTVNDNRTTEWIDSYGKVIWMQDLQPGTMYYVRAYAMTKGYAVGYGDVIKVPTLPQGNIHWSYGYEGDGETNDRIVKAASWAFDRFWSNLTQLTSFYPSLHFASGTPTADCSYGGWTRIGPNTSYQASGTIMHEALHGVGVGTHGMWGDFIRNQYPVWDALRFWNNDESATLSGDGTHMWPYGINGAHEDNGTEQLYIGNGLICEALGEAGLPLTASQWLLPYYAFPQDDDTKYYFKNESEACGLLTHYLVENAKGNLEWQVLTAAQARQAASNAAWYVTFDASIQKYRIRNATTNHYITFTANNTVNGFKTGTAYDIQIKKCRVNVAVGSQTYNGYYLLSALSNGQAMEAASGGAVQSTSFNIGDEATTQRWIILTDNQLTPFDTYATQSLTTELRRYLNGYKAVLAVAHTDKTAGATSAFSSLVNTIDAAISGTPTLDQVSHYLDQLKTEGLAFIDATMPSSDPYDLTFLIVNPDFTNDTDGWSLRPTHSYGAIEFYQTTFDFCQTLNDMPAGTYRLTANAFQRPGANADVFTAYSGGTDNVEAVIYINATSQRIRNVMSGQSTTSISNGEYTTSANTRVPDNMESGSKYMQAGKYPNSVETTIFGGPLTIGIRATVSADRYWTMADDFHLYYYGGQASAKTMLMANGFTKLTALPDDYSQYFFALYDHTYDLALTARQPNHQGGSMSMWYDGDANPMTNKTALWTMDNYMQSGTTYQVMANADNPDFMFQTEWNAGWNYRCSDNGGNGDLGWGRTQYAYLPDGYWTIQNGVYPEAGYLGPWENVIADDAETALNKLNDAIGHFDLFAILRGDYVRRFESGLANASESNSTDITYVLENPGAERRSTVGWTSTGTTWEVQANTSLVGKVSTRYFQIWNPDGVGNSELYQEISGLPNGKYRFSAIATASNQGMSLFANDVYQPVPTTNTAKRVSVNITVLNGTLRVGARAENTTAKWVAFDDARLEYIGNADAPDINGDGTADSADIMALMDIILGRAPSTYDTTAADLNGDNKVSIADLIKLISIIH